jgi:outer membrane protein assembly factor BamE (lipoprotein component of BamABCDE complex)
MHKLLHTMLIFGLLLSCTFEKNVKILGVDNLLERQKMIIASKSNKNDVILVLGETVLQDNINKNQWLYIETHKIKNYLGQNKVLRNNVLLVTFNNKGVVFEKKILTLKDMQELEIDDYETISRGVNSSATARIFSSVKKRIDTRKKELSGD